MQLEELDPKVALIAGLLLAGLYYMFMFDAVSYTHLTLPTKA